MQTTSSGRVFRDPKKTDGNAAHFLHHKISHVAEDCGSLLLDFLQMTTNVVFQVMFRMNFFLFIIIKWD